MSDENTHAIDKHVLAKYDIVKKLGEGVKESINFKKENLRFFIYKIYFIF